MNQQKTIFRDLCLRVCCIIHTGMIPSVHHMKAFAEVGYSSSLFNLGCIWYIASASQISRGKNPCYPFQSRLGRHLNRSGGLEKKCHAHADIQTSILWPSNPWKWYKMFYMWHNVKHCGVVVIKIRLGNTYGNNESWKHTPNETGNREKVFKSHLQRHKRKKFGILEMYGSYNKELIKHEFFFLLSSRIRKLNACTSLKILFPITTFS